MKTSTDKSLAAQVASEVRILVASRFTKKIFSVTARRDSRGGEVVIRWEDGPPVEPVELTVFPLKQRYQGTITLRLERSYSRAFLETVARAYCHCCHLPVPPVLEAEGIFGRRIETMYSGSLQVDREISRWCDRIAVSDLDSLAFRKDEEGYIWQSRLVVKKDYSAGMYPHLAVIGRPGYAKLSGPHVWFHIYDVIKRHGPHRVRVIEGAGAGTLFTSLDNALGALRQLATTGNVQLLYSDGTWHY